METKFLGLTPLRWASLKNLKEKIHESLSSVLPITLVVLALAIFFMPVELDVMGKFLFGAVLLIVGMGLFTLGADMAMLPIGTHMGAHLTKKKSLPLLCAAAFALGLLITMAEPDLTVLANQVQGVPNLVLMLTVAVGVGLFLIAALLRILFRKKLSVILLVLYGAVFALGILIRPEFVPMAFDAGGVTTGPMTVPFILALGVGVSNVRNGPDAQDDSFGLVALCSVGPILAVMLISLFFPNLTGTAEETQIVRAATTLDVTRLYVGSLPTYLKDVLISLLPIVVFFYGFQIFSLHLPGHEIVRITVGIVHTFLGLMLFLTGVNVGFLPMGQYLGQHLGAIGANWLLIPLGMLLGYLVVAAEPAVHVLNAQVEQVTSGAIRRSVMMTALSIGVSVSVGLAMTRVLTGISIWWFLAPGYAIALLLSFVTEPIFTAIAFDSGGVASGPMTAAFMLPLALGACGAVGGNVLTDAFGIVAMVAMTPLIAIEALGVVYRFKTHRTAVKLPAVPEEEEIIDI